MKPLIILLLAGAAAACTLGPDYKRPVVAVPDTYRGAVAPEPAAGNAGSIGDQAWWDVFQDDQLQELIRTAPQQNLDCASPRRASWRRRRSSASPERTSSQPSMPAQAHRAAAWRKPSSPSRVIRTKAVTSN